MRSLRLECLAGQEVDWRAIDAAPLGIPDFPAYLAMEVGAGKPPFLTCKFEQPKWFSTEVNPVVSN
ncbi:hypothetical protein BH20ACI3_BH20ACI3_26320 [soil metagenome]